MSDPFYGPFDSQPQPYWLPTPRRRELLTQALWDVPLGAYDRGVVDWIAGQDTSVVRVLAGFIERTRTAERRRQQARRVTPPRRAAGRPRGDMEAIAQQMRALGDEDLYALFREAARVRPSRLTAEVLRRADQARGQSNT